MKNGVKHSIPISTSFNVLKHININPSVQYNESWFFKEETFDSISNYGFWSVRDLQIYTNKYKIYGFIYKE